MMPTRTTNPAMHPALMLAISMIIIFSGCTGLNNKNQENPPDWVNGNSSHYSRQQYIIGRGQANSLSAAQDRARANIAKTFQVNIYERSSDNKQISQTTDKQGTSSSQEARIQRYISTETDQIIDGIEIAEVWKNPATKQFHTLAILSRNQAITRLHQQIKQLDNATTKSIAASRSSADTLTQAGFAAQALTAQQQRAAYQKMASIIDLSGRGVTPRWQPARLEADLNDILKRTHIQAVGTGPEKEAITSILAGALATAGLTPGDAEHSDYLLTGQLDIIDLGKRDGWDWQRATIHIKLTDKPGGKLRGDHSWTRLKAAGLDKNTAKQRLLDKIEQTLKDDMRQTLIDMATPKKNPL